MTEAPIDLLAVVVLDGALCIETIAGTTVGSSSVQGVVCSRGGRGGARC